MVLYRYFMYYSLHVHSGFVHGTAVAFSTFIFQHFAYRPVNRGECRSLRCKSISATVGHRVETSVLPEFRQTKLLRVWQGLWLALGFTVQF